MGVNAQTTVPTFTAGQVLTAAQLNNSARTGVPVFADTSARDAGFGGAGEKTLAEGQLCYLEDVNVVQYYDGATWATVGPTVPGGLVFIKSQTIGTTVSSVTVTAAFSATYDNYFVTVSGGLASTNSYLNLTLGATVTGYNWSTNEVTWGRAVSQEGNNADTSFGRVVYGSAQSLAGQFYLQQPFLTDETACFWNAVQTQNSGRQNQGGGNLADATSYTAFTLTTNTGTITGGTIRVYGIVNS